MKSFRHKADARRGAYLRLVNSVESQLREAYAQRHAEGKVTQASLARDLGVSRSVVHRRLMGGANLTLKSIADLLWALGQDADVTIFPADRDGSNRPSALVSAQTRPGAASVRVVNETGGAWADTTPEVKAHSVQGLSL